MDVKLCKNKTYAFYTLLLNNNRMNSADKSTNPQTLWKGPNVWTPA